MNVTPSARQAEWIDQAARVTATRLVSADDVRQHLWVQWLEHTRGGSFRDYVESDDKPRIQVTLQRWAGEYVRLEEEAAGQPQPDRHYYSKAELKQLLPFVESPEHWSSLAEPAEASEGGRSKADPALQGTALAVYSDLRNAWGRLDDFERWLLRERFVSAEPTDYLVLASCDEAGGRTAEALRKCVERAVGKMQRTLGGRRRADYTGSRKAVSNAQAQALAGRSWEG